MSVFSKLFDDVKAKVIGHHQAAGTSPLVGVIKTEGANFAAAQVAALNHQLNTHAGLPTLIAIEDKIKEYIAKDAGIGLDAALTAIAADVPVIVDAVEAKLPLEVGFIAKQFNGATDAFVVHYADLFAESLYHKVISATGTATPPVAAPYQSLASLANKASSGSQAPATQ